MIQAPVHLVPVPRRALGVAVVAQVDVLAPLRTRARSVTRSVLAYAYAHAGTQARAHPRTCDHMPSARMAPMQTPCVSPMHAYVMLEDAIRRPRVVLLAHGGRGLVGTRSSSKVGAQAERGCGNARDTTTNNKARRRCDALHRLHRGQAALPRRCCFRVVARSLGSRSGSERRRQRGNAHLARGGAAPPTPALGRGGRRRAHHHRDQSHTQSGHSPWVCCGVHTTFSSSLDSPLTKGHLQRSANSPAKRTEHRALLPLAQRDSALAFQEGHMCRGVTTTTCAAS